MDQTFEKRKKVIYDFICDDFYIPMKVKEIATVLQVSKEQRRELQEVLDAVSYTHLDCKYSFDTELEQRMRGVCLCRAPALIPTKRVLRKEEDYGEKRISI